MIRINKALSLTGALLGCALSTCALSLSCGAKIQDGGGTDTSTDWVRACQIDADCKSGQLCGCGLCTLECERDADCASLSRNAVCIRTPDHCGREQMLCAPDESFAWRLSIEDEEEATVPEPSLLPEQFENAVVPETEALSRDTRGSAWRVIEVPSASNEPSLVKTPLGWLALSRRSLGNPRVLNGPHQSVLYRSRDGVHWESLPLDPGHDDLLLSGITYGAGRYVMVGVRMPMPGLGVLWSSADGENWTEIEQSMDYADLWRKVTFTGERFFALGGGYLGVSTDGLSWTSVPITGSVQPRAVAHGNGRYLLVGGGSMQVSEDGYTWQAHDLDCALPGACGTDPSGGVYQEHQYNALFAEGRFFSDQLTSVDGIQWEPLPGRYPSAYVSGHFLSDLSPSGVQTWTSSSEPRRLHVVRPARQAVTAQGRDVLSIGTLDYEAPFPDSVNVEFEDGLSCETAECVIVGSHLLLVPPLNTPPLPDRVPRDAQDAPLLTDECRYSSQIFCDDYTARSGCVCQPDAPASPYSCDDVSQYQCAGAFTPQGDEWQVEEVAQAGCDCEAIDPNQPATFGSTCTTEAEDECAAPLVCLGIDLPPSFGPPIQPFVCTAACTRDADCPSWEATGFCSGPVTLRCSGGSCQPRRCSPELP